MCQESLGSECILEFLRTCGGKLRSIQRRNSIRMCYWERGIGGMSLIVRILAMVTTFSMMCHCLVRRVSLIWLELKWQRRRDPNQNGCRDLKNNIKKKKT